MLTELVKAGKLPPVEQRLPETAELMVVKPLKEIGKYGGRWRRGFTGPADNENGNRLVSTDKLLMWDYTGNTVAPCLVKDWRLSDDGKVMTLFLHKGLKWSDGQPFTADDFLFWYTDIYQNKELVPTPVQEFTVNGKPGCMAKRDDYTVTFEFLEPYFLLRVIAGEYDLQERHVSLPKLPVIIENQKKGNYTLHLDTAQMGSDAALLVNTAYEADPEIAKWLTTRDFRRALALGNRPQPAQRGLLAGNRDAGLLRAGRGGGDQPRQGIPEEMGGPRCQAGQRDARQHRAGQEGRRGVPATHRWEGARADRAAHRGRPVHPLHPDRRDDQAALAEDRDRGGRQGGRAQPGLHPDQ
jgi:hypothetical protein